MSGHATLRCQLLLMLGLMASGLTGLEMLPRVGPFEGGTLLTLYGYNFKNVSHTVRFYHIKSGTSQFQNASVINNSDQVTWADGCCTTCRECQSSLITTTLPAAGFLPDEYLSSTNWAFHAITVQVFESDKPTDVIWGFLYHTPWLITAVEPKVVSMFGGNSVTLRGDFAANLYSPMVRIFSPMYGGLWNLTTELRYVSDTAMKFSMPEVLLPVGVDSALFWVLHSANGLDFFNSSKTITVSKALSPLKVCFMFFNGLDDKPGWTYAANYGRLTLETQLSYSVRVVVQDQVRGVDAAIVQAKRFIEDGCRLIVGVHLTHRTAHLALADYPNSTTKFILSGEFFQPNEPNVGRCFPKLYESRYLSGIIAGRMTKTNVIGYVGSFPLPQIIRQANAFAIGVRKVNPNATVVFYTAGGWNNENQIDAEIGNLLLSMGADIVTQHTNGLTLQNLFHRNDRYSIGQWANYGATEGSKVLVSPMNLWGPCFIKYTKRVLFDAWIKDQAYFRGLKDGYSDLSPMSVEVPLDVQVQVFFERQTLIQGRDLYCGPLKDQQGNLVIERGHCLTNAELEDANVMNFFVAGIDNRGTFVSQKCDQGLIATYDKVTFEFSQCTVCPSGTEKAKDGDLAGFECVDCTAGRFSNVNVTGAMGSCQPCLVGTFSSQSGASGCTPCPAGYYQDNPSGTNCKRCLTGSDTQTTGSRMCCQFGFENDADGFCVAVLSIHTAVNDHIAMVIGLSVSGCTILILSTAFILYGTSRETYQERLQQYMLHRSPPSEGQSLTIAVTDIEGSTALWDTYPDEMHAALKLHDSLLRRLIVKHHGYELLTEGDSFTVAFHLPEDAVKWCLDIQVQLNDIAWSPTILSATKHAHDEVNFRGLRVRAGANTGTAKKVVVHPNTKRVQYTGDVLPIAKAVQGAAVGGQVLVSGDLVGQLRASSELEEGGHEVHLVHLGLHQLSVNTEEDPLVAAVAVEIEGDEIESGGETADEDFGIRISAGISEGIIVTFTDASTERNAKKREEERPPKESFTERNAKKNAHRMGHEIVMILPPTLKEREKHFPAINTVLKVTPSYYDAPDSSNVTTVFTYIEQANSMKVGSPVAWQRALGLHNTAVRQLLLEHNGYECREESGQFLLAFHSATDAMQFSLALQEALLQVAWPRAILEMPQACRMLVSGRIIFRGLRVQMGMVSGSVLECMPCRRTGRAEYFGPLLNEAARVANAAHGGQILIGQSSYSTIDPCIMYELGIQASKLGNFSLKGISEPETIYQVLSGRMRLRPFPPIKAKKQSSLAAFYRGKVAKDISRENPNAIRESTDLSLDYSNFSSVGSSTETGWLGRVCLHVHNRELRTQLKAALARTSMVIVNIHPKPLPAGLNALLKAASACQVLIMDVQSKPRDADLGVVPVCVCPFRWLDLIYEKLKPGDAFPDIVFAAAFGSSELALKHGASAFLPLPFEVSMLMEALKLSTNRSSSRRQLLGDEEAAHDPDEEEETCRRKELKRLRRKTAQNFAGTQAELMRNSELRSVDGNARVDSNSPTRNATGLAVDERPVAYSLHTANHNKLAANAPEGSEEEIFRLQSYIKELEGEITRAKWPNTCQAPS